jgi:hypothetical protein
MNDKGLLYSTRFGKTPIIIIIIKFDIKFVVDLLLGGVVEAPLLTIELAVCGVGAGLAEQDPALTAPQLRLLLLLLRLLLLLLRRLLLHLLQLLRRWRGLGTKFPLLYVTWETKLGSSHRKIETYLAQCR